MYFYYFIVILHSIHKKRLIVEKHLRLQVCRLIFFLNTRRQWMKHLQANSITEPACISELTGATIEVWIFWVWLNRWIHSPFPIYRLLFTIFVHFVRMVLIDLLATIVPFANKTVFVVDVQFFFFKQRQYAFEFSGLLFWFHFYIV